MGYADAEVGDTIEGEKVAVYIPSEKLAIANVSRNNVMQDGENNMVIKAKMRALECVGIKTVPV